MLAISRAYISNPQIVLVDEASMGLAPIVVDALFDFLERLESRPAPCRAVRHPRLETGRHRLSNQQRHHRELCPRVRGTSRSSADCNPRNLRPDAT